MNRRAVLLEIDFQPWVIDMAHDGGGLARARRIREKFRAEGALIVCTRYLSQNSDDRMRSNPDSDGARFHDVMAPQAGDLIATKFDRDIWTNPDLHSQLRINEINDITVIGLLTDFGVDLAARSALRMGYRVDVQSDGCAGTTIRAHRAALEAMADVGIEIVAGS